jgi:hypothetical protein
MNTDDDIRLPGMAGPEKAPTDPPKTRKRAIKPSVGQSGLDHKMGNNILGRPRQEILTLAANMLPAL